MPKGCDVRPIDWTSVIELYDGGAFSAIWGKHRGEKRLGVRWNGKNSAIGFPSGNGHPLWFVEPLFTTRGILTALLERVCKDPSRGDKANIIKALNDFDSINLKLPLGTS